MLLCSCVVVASCSPARAVAIIAQVEEFWQPLTSQTAAVWTAVGYVPAHAVHVVLLVADAASPSYTACSRHARWQLSHFDRCTRCSALYQHIAGCDVVLPGVAGAFSVRPDRVVQAG